MTTTIRTIRFKRGSSARLTQLNPILEDGEPLYIEDTFALYVGDGVTRYLDLQPVGYFQGGVTNEQLLDHINSLTPHPVYDDGPSLALIYENAKV